MLENENEIIKKAAKGDERAYEMLVCEYESIVYRLAYRMCGNREDALDVSQNAFLKAWKALPAFTYKSSFGTWIYRITVNAAKDLLAKKIEHSELSAEEERVADDSDPTENIIRLEKRDAVRKALGLLSPEHREILVLREMEEKSYREISDLLGIEEGTVKSRINRARAELKNIYLKLYENGEQIKKSEVKSSSKGGNDNESL